MVLDEEVTITANARLRYALANVRLVQIERIRAFPFAVLFGTGAAEHILNPAPKTRR